jgi:hypothetical protein
MAAILRQFSVAALLTALSMCLLLSVWQAPACGAAARRLEPPPHGFFTGLPKEYGRLLHLDGASMEVVLDRTGERLTRKLLPGADLFRHGAPATPADFAPGDRVWVVMEGSARRGERGDVRFLADEISVQEIHTEWYALKEIDPERGTLTIEASPPAPGKAASLVRLTALPALKVRLGARAGKLSDLAPGVALRFQTRYENGTFGVTVLADAAGFEALGAEQRRALDRQLAREGLPGTAAGGLITGDWEVVVDRAGALWARSLSPEDTVRLRREDPPNAPAMSAAVRSVHPWGERTLVVVTPRPAAAPPPAAPPARVRLLMERPRAGALPPGLGRATAPSDRIDWILASIYCTCSNRNDVCTGQLYTLSLCHPTGCPMPKYMRGKLAAWIADGKSDAEILKLIESEQGPNCHRMHLVK